MIQELTLVILGQTLLGSVIILTAYQKIKELLGLEGTVATVVAFVFGGLLGVAVNLLHLVAPAPLLYSILQGLVSAWIATGGYDLFIKGKY